MDGHSRKLNAAMEGRGSNRSLRKYGAQVYMKTTSPDAEEIL
ncbi:MAG TPA: hypothetical protein VI933_04170 [archaeon]|nr:hypothetical protein [archaeon]